MTRLAVVRPEAADGTGTLNIAGDQDIWAERSGAKGALTTWHVASTGGGQYWPSPAAVGPGYPFGVGTSSSIFDNRGSFVGQLPTVSPKLSRYRQLVVAGPAGQLREVSAALSLNKSQLAEVLRVSRPTLYEWFGGSEPNPTNAQRLSLLLRILTQVGVTAVRPVNARFVRQPFDERGRSLLDELTLERLDEHRIETLLEEASSLSEASAQARQEREQRLRDLAYEEPNAEQRRDQLGYNVAALDWPKS